MLYNYVAKDEKGKTVTGEVEALNKKAAANLLRERNYILISLTEKSKAFDVSRIFEPFRRVSLTDKVNFTQQLSTMISAGLTLSRSLGLFLAQLKDSRVKDIVKTVLDDVESGSSFSSSLEKFPNVFSNTYISLIKAGEASGNLDIVLQRLADTLEKQRSFKSKVMGALLYPIIVVVAMVGVMVIILVFVVPKLTQMYSSLSIELPLPTKILLGISGFFTNRWYILLAFIVLFVVGFRYYKSTKLGRYQLSKMAFKLPIFGNLNKEKELAEFTRTLGLLIGAGVPIVDSLNISLDSVGNLLYRDAIRNAADKVEKGVPLSEPLAADSSFPPIVSQMINVGQETGKLDEVLLKLAQYFESEVDKKLKNLTTALEPVIMVVLGAMVGLLILSVITPIYKLTSSF